MLKIEKLHKSYPIGNSSIHVLKGIDFSVEKGEMVAIMGSSGEKKEKDGPPKKTEEILKVT